MSAVFGPLRVALPVGRHEFTIDTPGAQGTGVLLTLTNAGWALGTVAAIECFFSYDGGLTFPDGVSCPVTETTLQKGQPAGTVQIGVFFKKVTDGHGGMVVKPPTHARATVSINQAATSTVSLEWL